MIIIIAIIIAAILIFNFELFFHEAKSIFFYQEDWLSLIMIFALALSLGGIFKILAMQTAHKVKK